MRYVQICTDKSTILLTIYLKNWAETQMPTYWETKGPGFVLPQVALLYQEWFRPGNRKKLNITKESQEKRNERIDQTK